MRSTRRSRGTKPHSVRSARARTAGAYRECMEQMRLADKYGFNTVWFVEHHFREGRSHCPAPEVVIGALTQVTKNMRLGFGVTLLPYGFTHPSVWPRRSRPPTCCRAVASSGAPGARRRWSRRRSTSTASRAATSGRRPSRSSSRRGSRSASSGTRRRSSSPAHGHAEAVPGSPPAGWMAATSPTRARSRAVSGSACCRSRSCSRSRRWRSRSARTARPRRTRSRSPT